MHLATGNNVLLRCLGIGPERMGADSPRHISESVWDEVIRQAKQQRVTSLLYQRLRTLRTEISVPANILQKLQETYLRTALRNAYIHNELSKILGVMRNSGIPVVILKGAALAELVYQDIALRPMNDVDFLVRDRDMWRVPRVLSQVGFELRKIMWSQTIYVNESIPIEVKSKMGDFPNLDPWVNVSRVTLASNDTLILRPEVFLIHLCLHTERHLSRTQVAILLWWFDITELLERYREKFDWDYVIRIVRENEVAEAVHRVLHMAREDFGARIPTDVLSQVGGNGATISASQILYSSDVLMDKQTTAQSQTSRSKPPLLNTPARRSYSNVIHHILRDAFPCREYMMQRYSIKNPILVYFYYPARISVNIARVVKKLIRYCYR